MKAYVVYRLEVQVTDSEIHALFVRKDTAKASDITIPIPQGALTPSSPQYDSGGSLNISERAAREIAEFLFYRLGDL